MTTDPNDTVYPIERLDRHGNVNKTCNGITKREYFASLALQSLKTEDNTCSAGELAEVAVLMADALIAELNKTK